MHTSKQMGNLNSQPPVVVVHQGPRKNSKIYIDIFTNTRVDDIIEDNKQKRKPLIPHNHKILDLSVGEESVERYRKKYKI